MRELSEKPRLVKARCTRCLTVFSLREHNKCPQCHSDVVMLITTPDARQTFAQDERKAQPL